MGELTDTTNRAQGYSLLPAVWCIGATIGFVPKGFYLIFYFMTDERLGHYLEALYRTHMNASRKLSQDRFGRIIHTSFPVSSVQRTSCPPF